jgi:hypothetical protein
MGFFRLFLDVGTTGLNAEVRDTLPRVLTRPPRRPTRQNSRNVGDFLVLDIRRMHDCCSVLHEVVS